MLARFADKQASLTDVQPILPYLPGEVLKAPIKRLPPPSGWTLPTGDFSTITGAHLLWTENMSPSKFMHWNP